MSRRAVDLATRAKINAGNRDRGHQAERVEARYLRTWWPEAQRKSDNGWRSSDHVSADKGDITGTPGLTWQVKHVAQLSDLDRARAMQAAEEQAVAAGTDYALLVERRPGKADPARWWVWLRACDLVSLLGGAGLDLADPVNRFLVRSEQHAVIALLLRNGYGTQPGG